MLSFLCNIAVRPYACLDGDGAWRLFAYASGSDDDVGVCMHVNNAP